MSEGVIDVDILGHISSWRLARWDQLVSTVDEHIEDVRSTPYILSIGVPRPDSSTRLAIEEAIEGLLDRSFRREYATEAFTVVLPPRAQGDDGGLFDRLIDYVMGFGAHELDGHGPVRPSSVAKLLEQRAFHEPLVIIFEELDDGELDELEHLRTICAARRPSSPILFVVLCEGDRTPDVDLCRAWPVHRAVNIIDPSIDELTRWQTYVHYRFAWLFGGHLGALEFARERAGAHPGIGRADDNTLEAALNRHASILFEGLEDRVRHELHGWRTNPRVLESTRPRELIRPLLQAPLGPLSTIWYTDLAGCRRTQLPVPWVARALLIPSGHTWCGCKRIRSWLRQLLLCRPIIEAALGSCLQAETTLRFELNNPGLLSEAPPDGMSDRSGPKNAWEMCQEFFDSADRIPRSTYPNEHPGLPGHYGLEFLSLGAIAYNTAYGTPRRASMQQLSWIRNALAHQTGDSWDLLSLLTTTTNVLFAE